MAYKYHQPDTYKHHWIETANMEMKNEDACSLVDLNQQTHVIESANWIKLMEQSHYNPAEFWSYLANLK